MTNNSEEVVRCPYRPCQSFGIKKIWKPRLKGTQKRAFICTMCGTVIIIPGPGD